MKVVALAVLTVLIALPAEAVQRQNNFSQSCNNDGRCTTFNASTASQTPSLRGHHIRTSERKPHHVVDANGNSMLVTVQTAYGFNITVHPAYASKFQKFFALLKDVATKCQPTSPSAGPGTARMYLAPTTTSVRLAIFRRAEISGPRSLPHGRHRQRARPVQRLRSTIAVVSKRSVARTTERPTFRPPWKNSNRNNRQQTINHEHLQERFVVCATTFGQTDVGRYNNPEKTFCGNRSRPLRYVKGLIEQLRYTEPSQCMFSGNRENSTRIRAGANAVTYIGVQFSSRMCASMANLHNGTSPILAASLKETLHTKSPRIASTFGTVWSRNCRSQFLGKRTHHHYAGDRQKSAARDQQAIPTTCPGISKANGKHRGQAA